MNHRRQALTCSKHSRLGARRSALTVAALAILLLLVSVAASPGVEAKGGGLYSALTRMARLSTHQLRPRTTRLAADLPETAGRLKDLREPASTAETQVGIALGELQQMSALIYDPHYAPALVAAGRAFVAITGRDPLTRTAINPEYQGLGHELAADASSVETSGRNAAKALSAVKRLSRELARSKRRAGRLERELRRLRTRRTKTAFGSR